MRIPTLYFPSGLSVRRAKRMAKQLAQTEFIPLSKALDVIAHQEVRLPWHKAQSLLVDQSPSKKWMSRSDIKAILNAFPHLNYWGPDKKWHEFRSGQITRDEMEQDFHENRARLLQATDECNRACLYLEFMHSRKTINWTRSSYSLKHSVENVIRYVDSSINPYVANGCFICAAIFKGFEVEQHATEELKAFLNFSSRSPIIQLDRSFTIRPKSIKEREQVEAISKQVQSVFEQMVS
ncbi:hypothetical protein [Gynuella sunshinyii]|uniref:Uncharacterized protein n=2 Tax=Gynuella TaxID=1445504 RepID=A0A0C5VDN5_9GAMM|nr:hypothetical protein [Gynuella sunshinyii]AJQ92306.1 hypothetical Protein YC6258_00254 [Gynuella sunshinyii YC6258]